MIINLNNSWEYYEKFDERHLKNSRDVGENVRLPHTFKVLDANYANPKLYQRDSIYVKKIEFDELWNEKRVFLNIEGAAHYSKVYLNGEFLNEHSCGYTYYKTEITNGLVKGENILAIRVDSTERHDIPPFGGTVDYLAYSGLYREVSLEIKNKSYIEDVYIHTEGKKVTADTVIENDNEGYVLNYKLLDNNQITDLGSKLNSKECDVVFWDVDNPKLYTLIVSLYNKESLIDQKKIRFGFRDIRFEKDGFYINGKKLKLRGLNRHQSYPYIGYAMPKSGQVSDADLLKNDLGLNCVRTSHYPQSKHFIERCDEIGLLVFTEMPGWQHIGDKDWQRISIENVKDMVLQYRNHPSIMLWGVRINESKDLDSFYKKTNDVARELDPYRQTGGVRCYENGHLLEDVYTFNDFLYDGKNDGVRSRKKVTGSAEVPYMVTEYNGHMFPCKPFDSEEKLLEHALRHARVLNDIAMHNDIAGGFGWCMSDYQTHVDFGGDDIICYHGVTDMFRNLKPAGYVYKSQSNREPVMEIMPSMNLGENSASILGKVYAFTNTDYIELFINNRLINRFYPDTKHYSALLHPPIEIDDIIGDKLDDEKYKGSTKKSIKKLLLKYSREGLSSFTIKDKLEALKLMVFNGMKSSEFTRLYETYIGNWGGKRPVFKFVGYINDKEAITVIKGAYESKHLEAEVDHMDLIDGETYDIATVKLRMLNQNNQVMRYYQEPIEIETEGPIEIVGPNLISLKGGMGGTYVKTVGETGKAKLIFKIHGTEDVILEFAVKHN
ncbi:MAG: glycoside hydrolase family 2 protein [Peptostreptococcaceae bacterium]|nr:glycoside hydrolase family 2 protein [Peptostreptococcaceae bacterium]